MSEWTEAELREIADKLQEFVDSQQPLDPECARILQEHYWELLADWQPKFTHTDVLAYAERMGLPTKFQL